MAKHAVSRACEKTRARARSARPKNANPGNMIMKNVWDPRSEVYTKYRSSQDVRIICYKMISLKTLKNGQPNSPEAWL